MIDPDADPDQLDLEDLLACSPSRPIASSASIVKLAAEVITISAQDDDPCQLSLPLPGLIAWPSSDTAP